MRLVFASLLVAFAVAACSDKDEPTALRAVTGLQPSAQSDRVYPDERRAVELAREIPGLAGFFYDSSANLVVTVKDLPRARTSASLLRPRFGKELARARRGNPHANLILRSATYSFLDLKGWRDRLMGADVLNLPGVVWLDLDEVANRVVIGLDAGGDPAAIRAATRNLGIPLEAIDFESSGPLIRQQTLQDAFRPIAGGIQIQRVSGTSRASCTLGFTAIWNNQQVFVTAGHCSPNLTGTDSVAQYQPLAPLTHADSLTMTPIGREISQTSTPCGNRRCSYSDAAIYGLIPTGTWGIGHIARPTYGCALGPCNPPNLIVTANPWVIDTTRGSFVVNDLVSEIGASTGWSQGWVQRTCVNIAPFNGVQYNCQMFANYGSGDGDSGAPILLDVGPAGDSTVTLGGIHSGRSGKNAVFSPWSGIVQDYGNLVVVRAPIIVPPVPPDSDPAWLYDDTLIVRNSTRLSAPFVRNVVVVLFAEGTSQGERQSAVDQIGGLVVGGSVLPGGDGFYLVRIADDGTETPLFQALVALEARPSVEMATPEVLETDPLNYLRPNDGAGWLRRDWALSPDSASGDNWGPEAVAAPLAWGCAIGDSATVVAVVDHGVTDQLDDLRPNLRFTYHANGFPTVDHASAVASVFAAVGNNQLGITGMMWHANLRLYEAAQFRGSTPVLVQGGPVFSNRVNAATVARAAGDGARVINVSLGKSWSPVTPGSAADTLTIRRIVQPMAAVIRRMRGPTAPLIVFSAGNDGLDAFWNGYPILVDSFPDRVIAVAASARGNTLYARSDTGHLVSLVAPGQDVTALNHLGAPVAFTGTSFAAPVAAGVAGLLFSFQPSLTATQARQFLVTGAQASGRSVNGIPLVNAYASLRLAGQQLRAPLCGNRVWVSNETVYAERDTATHSTEQLASLGDTAAYADVRHGGHRFEVYGTHSGFRAFELRQGQWVETQDTATTPYGGAYLSLLQYSHDLDSTVGITSHPGDGFVDLDVNITQFSPRTTTRIQTIHVPLPSSGSYMCFYASPISECPSGDSIFIGTSTNADWRVAYSPQGGRVFVAVTYLVTQTMSTSYSTCPWPPGGDQSCLTASYRTTTDRTDVHEISLPTGSDAVLWTIPGRQVYWAAGSEDGAQLVNGEGQMTQDYVIEPYPDRPGWRFNAQPQVVTGCSIVYRIAATSGTQLHSVLSDDACRGDQGQGTLAPIRTALR